MRILILLLIGIIVSSCNPPKYDIIKKEDITISKDAKFIDVVSVMESHKDNDIIEYSGSSWTVAVRNLETGDTYYFDSANNFIGRKKKVE
ncbi:MAG: hypothetical protein KBB01_03305 [Candidatus Omnitrophica bacterium]|jgi:hypothetical protein|nr:hypothetical protein [Candidatus Omnitrophota bacterium]